MHRDDRRFVSWSTIGYQVTIYRQTVPTIVLHPMPSELQLPFPVLDSGDSIFFYFPSSSSPAIWLDCICFTRINHAWNLTIKTVHTRVCVCVFFCCSFPSILPYWPPGRPAHSGIDPISIVDVCSAWLLVCRRLRCSCRERSPACRWC